MSATESGTKTALMREMIARKCRYTRPHMSHSRRQFLAAAAATFAAAGAIPQVLDAAGFDPFEKTIRELQRAMAAGQITSARLVQFYLGRIDAYDQAGPRVNAVLQVNPNAAA